MKLLLGSQYNRRDREHQLGREGEDILSLHCAMHGMPIKHRGDWNGTDWRVVENGRIFEGKHRPKLIQNTREGLSPYLDTNKMDNPRVRAALWHDTDMNLVLWAPKAAVIASPVKWEKSRTRYDQESELFLVPLEWCHEGLLTFIKFMLDE